MKLIKTICKNDMIIYDHGIYKLDDEEIKFTERKRFMLCPIMNSNIYDILDMSYILGKIVKESKYVYGVALCDTLYECELSYKCMILDLKNRHIMDKLNRILEENSKNKINYWSQL